MTKHTIYFARSLKQLTLIGATLTALGVSAQANPCPLHRQKSAVGFYQQAVRPDSYPSAATHSTSVRYQAAQKDDNRYEPPNRPGFDGDLR
jgi:hypothetical protein